MTAGEGELYFGVSDGKDCSSWTRCLGQEFAYFTETNSVSLFAVIGAPYLIAVSGLDIGYAELTRFCLSMEVLFLHTRNQKSPIESCTSLPNRNPRYFDLIISFMFQRRIH